MNDIFNFDDMILIILQYTVGKLLFCYDFESWDDQFDFPCGGCQYDIKSKPIVLIVCIWKSFSHVI